MTFDDIEPYMDAALTEVIGMAVMLGISAHRKSPMITRFNDDARIKFDAGQKEHNNDWNNWVNDDFRREMRDELIDAVIYMAAMKARQQDAYLAGRLGS